MITLNKTDIQQLFTMKDAIKASETALRLHAEKKGIVPLRTPIHIPKAQAQCLFMPAYVADLNIAGIKIVAVFPENIQQGKPSLSAKMILIDGLNGEMCAMLDGTYLTQLRTGALQGLATDKLARKDAKIAALFGTGAQARTQLEAMLSVRHLETIRVFDIHFERAVLFAAEMKKEFDVNIIATRDKNKTIEEADIITTITTSKTPVFDFSFIKPGTHINGIGAYTPDMQELPSALIQAAHKIIVDTREGVLNEAGDIIIPMQVGHITEKNMTGELGDLLLGKIKGREHDHEVTVFKSVGTAILDIVTAYAIYQKSLAA